MIQTKGCYYMILFVYISLWCCQLITCHLTHSLIVLTDSYINLYKILDISLGILHLNTQRRASSNPAIKLFDTVCTYQFKRLPVLGSFVNGLFLAALLMSAAIEGIQTCFHANHSGSDSQASILLDHPITYPGILVGFALVGAMMQWCSIKAHEMREQELGSESLLDIRANNDELAPGRKVSGPVSELDVGQLHGQLDGPLANSSESREKVFLAPPEISPNEGRKFVLTQSRPNSFETVPLDDTSNDDQFTKISLKSLKLVSDTLEDHQLKEGENSVAAINSISKDLESEGASGALDKRGSISDRWWLIVRYCASPVALVACALIIYFIHEEMVTEIADATFAISVVILLFTASYPPTFMNR